MATDDRDMPAGAAGGRRDDMPAGPPAPHADNGRLDTCTNSGRGSDTDCAPGSGNDASLSAAAGEQTGAAGKQTAAAGKQTAAAGKQTAAAGEQTRAAGKQTRAAGKQTRAAGKQTGAAGEQTGAAGEQTGAAGKQTAAAGKQTGGHGDDDFEPYLPPGPNPFSSVHPQGAPPYRPAAADAADEPGPVPGPPANGAGTNGQPPDAAGPAAPGDLRSRGTLWGTRE